MSTPTNDTSVPETRTTLALKARELVAADPATAIEKFRTHIKGYWQAGLAYVTEPAVRVLATELRKTKDGANYDPLIQEFIDDCDTAQENAQKPDTRRPVFLNEKGSFKKLLRTLGW